MSPPALFRILPCLWPLLLAPCVAAQHYRVWRHFNSNNGLPQNSVVQLEIDTAGSAWIGTESGLVRFDGGGLRTIDLRADDAVPAQRIRKVTPTAKGEIIVQDARGNIYRVDHGPPALLARDRQRWAMRGGVPSAWVHVARSEPRRPYSWDLLALPVSHALSVRDHVVVDMDTIQHWRDTTLVGRALLDRPMQQTFFLDDHAIGLAPDGTSHRIDIRTGRTARLAVAGPPLPAGMPWPVIHWHDRRSEAFMVYGQDLYGLNLSPMADTLVVTAFKADMPAAHTISDIMRMPCSGIILVGTSSTGLYLLREDPIAAMGCHDLPEAHCSVFSHIVLDNGDMIQVCPPNAFLWSNGHCSEIVALRHLNPFNLVKDHEGRIWFWRERVLWRYDHMDRSVEPMMEEQEHPLALKALGDSLLIANDRTVWSWRNGRFRPLASLNATSAEDRPSVLALTENGRLLYGSDTGLFIQEGGTGSGFRPIEGLEGADIRDIAQIEDLLLVCTYGSGWYALRDGRPVRLPNDPNDCLEYAHSFVLKEGALWISTNRGLVRTTLEDIRTYLADPAQRPYFGRYGSASGVTNLEFNGGMEPPVAEWPDGSLSYPSIEGVVRLDPRTIPDPFPHAALTLGRIRVNGAERPTGSPLDLPYNVEAIEFEFSLTYWGDPENAQVEHRIPGIVDEWRPIPTGQRTIVVVRPPPGRYEVFLRKVGSAARGIEARPFRTFSVARPWWATWPAFVAYAALLFLLFRVGSRWNTARLTRRNRWLEENVARQTDALQHANEELRRAVSHQEKLISVISHDVVPPLRFVARVARSAEHMLREGKPGDDLAETLADLSTSTEKLHDNAEGLLTWIRTRSQQSGPVLRPTSMHAFVHHALDRVSEMFDQAGIRTINQVEPDDLIITDPDLLGIVVYNLLMNVRLHSRATEAKLSGHHGADGYSLCIRDNGSGMPPRILARLEGELRGDSQLDDHERKGAATGLGFVIIAECARQLNASITLSSSGAGTEVRILLQEDRRSDRAGH